MIGNLSFETAIASHTFRFCSINIDLEAYMVLHFNGRQEIITAEELILNIVFVKNNVVPFIQGMRADVENGEIMTFDLINMTNVFRGIHVIFLQSFANREVKHLCC